MRGHLLHVVSSGIIKMALVIHNYAIACLHAIICNEVQKVRACTR